MKTTWDAGLETRHAWSRSRSEQTATSVEQVNSGMHTIRLINNTSETEGSMATGKTMNKFLIISPTHFLFLSAGQVSIWSSKIIAWCAKLMISQLNPSISASQNRSCHDAIATTIGSSMPQTFGPITIYSKVITWPCPWPTLHSDNYSSPAQCPSPCL